VKQGGEKLEERNLAEELFLLGSTVYESEEWENIEKREYSMGADNLLDEIILKDEWSNAEMMWVLKKMIYHYGKKDKLLKLIPDDRMFLNIVDILRILYILLDQFNPELDINMRRYLSVKMTDSTWGLNSRTRGYLYKIGKKE